MLKKFLLFPVALLLFFSTCREPDDIDGLVYDPTPVSLQQPQFFPPIEIPADNPLTEEGIQLGKRLFYDPILSGDNTLACAGCHKQSTAFTDTRRFSKGIDGIDGNRNSMALFNLVYPSSFFWDGRSATLEEQILEPVPNPIEMHEEWPNAVTELESEVEYLKLFYLAFGDSVITKEKTAKAIAQFLRTIISSNSRYDKHLRGELFGTSAEWTEAEDRGFEIFMGNFTGAGTFGDCFHCHGNILFHLVGESDQFKNNGLQQAATLNDFTDTGRGAITGNTQDNGKFKIPSLRNIELTAPYMHDGRFNTLEEVVNFYSEGVQHSPTIDPLMEAAQQGGVQLTTQQKQDLVTFLKALTDQSLASNTAFSDPF